MTDSAYDHADRRVIETPHYIGPERRRNPVILHDSQIEEIAERAAQKAVAHMTDQAYRQIGKSVVGMVGKALIAVGVVATAAYLWLEAKGLLE